MDKLSTDSRLGISLREQRKRARWTQAELARHASLTAKTLGLLERGSGSLRSWDAALRALGLRLSGRNLPGGTTLGLRLTTLRRRRGLSQEALARSVGVTKPTLGALEREGKGRLSTLQRVLVVLGTGHYLAPRKGSATAFYTHAGNSSTHQAWETPATLLDALALVFKRFDLDPCASRKSRSHVRARVRTDNASRGFFRQRIAPFVSPRTDSASRRSEVEANAARGTWAPLRSRSLG